jgi:hypothetical protein
VNSYRRIFLIRWLHLLQEAKKDSSNSGYGVTTVQSGIKHSTSKVSSMLTNSHIGGEQQLTIGWIEKLSTMHTLKITSTKINTRQTTRIELVWIDRMIMNNSQTSPYINKLTVRSQTSQIKIRTDVSSSMKFEIVNFKG